MRDEKNLANGFEHGFVPLKQIDLSKVESFSDLLEQMSQTAFGGRALGTAADVMCKMFSDPDCLVVATLSGAMTIAKQGGIIADLIERDCIDIIVSTGAIICHGLIDELGYTHFKHEPGWTDESLYDAGYNRVYDTVEPEKNMGHAEKLVFETLAGRKPDNSLSSAELCRLLGEKLTEKAKNKGILQAAFGKNVPVFIPAFTDSELGLDVEIYNSHPENDRITFDPMLDLQGYCDLVSRAKYLGILTIGGGVPRNWAQQIGPYSDALCRRGILDVEKPVRFKYGVRICPEPDHWGGLSGCSYSEGISWGKFISAKDGGCYAEVPCDATIAFPVLTATVFERLGLLGKSQKKTSDLSGRRTMLHK